MKEGELVVGETMQGHSALSSQLFSSHKNPSFYVAVKRRKVLRVSSCSTAAMSLACIVQCLFSSSAN